MTGQVRTVDGRVAGRRGQATRQKLLDCLGEMLSTSPYRDVKVIDVARMAGTSPATFYQYFPDVEGAVLELAEEMAKEGAGLTDLVAGRSWVGKSGAAAAEELVDGFLAFWRKHDAILRVVDLRDPVVYENYRRRIRELAALGIDGVKGDRGDEVEHQAAEYERHGGS